MSAVVTPFRPPIEKSVPHDLTAERAVLGSCLLERDAILVIAVDLDADDFYLQKNAWVYEALLECYRARIPPDLSTVADALRRAERLELVGGIAYLGELGDEVPAAVHVEYYAGIVRAAATRRRLIETGGKIAALGYDERDDVEVSLAEARRLVDGVANGAASSHLRPLGAAATDWLRDLEQAVETGVRPGLSTGLQSLDLATSGLHPGHLVVLGARPATGKSTLAMQIGWYLAQQERRVLVFSLEMTLADIERRLASQLSGVPVDRMLSGGLTRADLGRVRDAMEWVRALSGYLPLVEPGDHSPTPPNAPMMVADGDAIKDADRLYSLATAHAHRYGTDLIIIDHLQLMQAAHTKGDNYKNVTYASGRMKSLAKAAGCPVLLLSQLSRGLEARQDKTPQLSDLRQSGSVEQDADMVLLLERGEPIGPDERHTTLHVHVAKARHGEPGMCVLGFDTHLTRCYDRGGYDAMEGY